MTPARHHAEWLSLVETSGPFLSMPVLLRVFPQGLEQHDPDKASRLREAYEDWLERGAKQPAIHYAWIRHVLTKLLEYLPEFLVEGQGIPPGMEAVMANYGETLRPEFVLKHRDSGHKPVLLVEQYAPDQNLEKPVAGKAWKASPGTRMMELLHAADVPLGLVTNGEQWMLVYAPRGETTGFASWYADLWMQDPESRIMKAGNGNHFEQSYNAPAAVEVESRLIVGQRVSQAPNDKQELVPTLAAIPAEAGPLATALVDSGFFSEKAVPQVERAGAGPVVYAAVAKAGHHRSVADLEIKPEPAPPAADASVIEVMRHRLQTTAGRNLYKLRQQTVEPVFGIIKSVLGFRQFRLRGRAKVALEWTLVCLAYNLKRLHRLGAGLKLAVAN